MADDLRLTGAQAAYIGDAVWSLYVRRKMVLTNIRMAQTTTIITQGYVNAVSQAKVIMSWLNQGILSEDEIRWFKAGRNIKINHPSNHEDIESYRYASGFEAILGQLYMHGLTIRLYQLMDQAYDSMVKSL